jgi:outer membrane protein OmpA-like peptidoglycan-associated protein
MWMKGFMFLALVAVLIISGCASKGYVNETVDGAVAAQQAEIEELKAKAALNTDDIKKLQTLSAQLSDKADMALNKAKGFENYQVIWEGVINYDFDSYELTQIAMDNLEELGVKMTDYPRSLLELIGHTDQTGPDTYNFELGMKRAESVKRFLIDNYGVALYRMFTASQGENKPVALPDETNANSKNRRVVLKLWGEL